MKPRVSDLFAFKINFGAKGEITYLYNATGQKIKKLVKTTSSITTTDYLSGFQYLNTILQFFPHAEGYVHYTKPLQVEGLGAFNYVFNYTDHLGNVRVSFAEDPQQGNVLKILEENHYYPFGMKHENYNVGKLNFKKFPDTGVEIVPAPAVANASYNYKYNGKELQEELGLNMYDYGARNYDPALGRFFSIDPKAETSRRWTTYNYAYNNPMRFIDPDGMQADDWRNKEGKLIYDPKANEGKGAYTKDATEEDKKIGDALNSTEDGKKQFDLLVNSDIPTEIEVTEEKGPSDGTNNYQMGNTALTKDENKKVESAKITIYAGRIDDFLSVAKTYFDAGKQDLLEEQNKAYGELNDKFSSIIANIGHEIEHANNPKNHIIFGSDSEIDPEKIETNILKQFKQNKK